MVAPVATKIPAFPPHSGWPARGGGKRLTLRSYAATIEQTVAPIVPLVDPTSATPSLALRVAAGVVVALTAGLLMSRAAAMPPSVTDQWMQRWVLPASR